MPASEVLEDRTGSDANPALLCYVRKGQGIVETLHRQVLEQEAAVTDATAPDFTDTALAMAQIPVESQASQEQQAQDQRGQATEASSIDLIDMSNSDSENVQMTDTGASANGINEKDAGEHWIEDVDGTTSGDAESIIDIHGSHGP